MKESKFLEEVIREWFSFLLDDVYFSKFFFSYPQVKTLKDNLKKICWKSSWAKN